MFNYNDTINPGDVIAVGDIHGRYDLLDGLMQKLRGTQAVVIFLGDMIDRGGQDVQVVERVRKLTEDPESEGLSGCFALLGNHEDMFIDAVEKGSTEFFLWQQNGGNFDQFAELQEHLDWFNELPIFITIGSTLYIHGGIWPGKDPFEAVDQGRADTLLWMRSPFLEEGPQFEKWNPELKQVVFGHTPKLDENEGKPYRIPQGICIDTGAFFSNTLTAYNADTDSLIEFTAVPSFI